MIHFLFKLLLLMLTSTIMSGILESCWRIINQVNLIQTREIFRKPEIISINPSLIFDVCCSLEYTFRTIFWALFGLKEAWTVELGDSRAKARGDPAAKQFKGRFTESVGYIVFGVYNWGAVIVLLNMLIAMMTRSFDKIAVS